VEKTIFKEIMKKITRWWKLPIQKTN
jgi:hypothetical protein